MESKTPVTQQLSSKLGEVKFRKKLTDQHTGRKYHFEGEPDESQILAILKERVTDTRRIFKQLAKKGVTLSPFLEIGAEKGQRASLLTSEFNAGGFALDISFESLKSAKYFAQKLKLSKTPTLICADAENLPFTDSSIPFVFAFQTLHHFPTPKKVISEMQRVSMSHIFFSEEPIKQIFNLDIWRRKYNLNCFEKVLKLALVLPFLSKLGGSESQYDVLENEFSISTWQKSMSSLDDAEISVEPVFWGPKSTFKHKQNWQINPVTRILTAVEGGGITILAPVHHSGEDPAKAGDDTRIKKTDLFDLLACPHCHKSNFKKLPKKIICASCKSTYPIKDGVYIMLPPALAKKLYGQF